MKCEIPAGRYEIEAPKPFRVEYPFGLPGDGFRRFADPYKSMCVAYHRGVDPAALAELPRGNELRYGPGDPLWERYLADMRENGYRGGDGGRIHVHVRPERTYVAEGNHRIAIALAAGVTEVEIEVRYYDDADVDGHLIPFDPKDPGIRVISD